MAMDGTIKSFLTDLRRPALLFPCRKSKQKDTRSFVLRYTALDTLFLKLIRTAQGRHPASVVLFGHPWPQPDKLLTEKEHRARSQSDGESGCQIRISCQSSTSDRE